MPFLIFPQTMGKLLLGAQGWNYKDWTGNSYFALKVQNRNWLFDDFSSLLHDYNVTLVQIDHPWFPHLTKTTADFAFIRWLGYRKQIKSDFSHVRFDRTEEYEWWAEMIKNTLPSIRKLYA